MPKEPKRRFDSLDTDEVSLVDTPANESPFLVTKNQENNMSTKNQNTNGEEGVRVPVEIEGGSDAVTKAMEHVNSIVDNIANLVKKNNSDEQSVESVDEGSESNPENTSDTGDQEDVSKATLKSVLMSAGLSGDALQKACGTLKKQGFNPNMKFPNAKAPVTKSADENEETENTENISENTEPFTMESFAEAVQKAAAFTPSRIKQLQDAADILKLVLESIAPNATPMTRVPRVTTHGNPSPVSDLAGQKKMPRVTKNDDGGNELIETLKSLGSAVEKINERVEAIEKTRNPSNSADDEGGTDTNVQKSEGFWDGAL